MSPFTISMVLSILSDTKDSSTNSTTLNFLFLPYDPFTITSKTDPSNLSRSHLPRITSYPHTVFPLLQRYPQTSAQFQQESSTKTHLFYSTISKPTTPHTSVQYYPHTEQQIISPSLSIPDFKASSNFFSKLDV